MHTIQTFILRLLVDTDEPQALRGTVRSVASDEKHPFADGKLLLALLCKLKVAPVEAGNSQGEVSGKILHLESQAPSARGE